jgi:hypothetical protein
MAFIDKQAMNKVINYGTASGIYPGRCLSHLPYRVPGTSPGTSIVTCGVGSWSRYRPKDGPYDWHLKSNQIKSKQNQANQARNRQLAREARQSKQT